MTCLFLWRAVAEITLTLFVPGMTMRINSLDSGIAQLRGLIVEVDDNGNEFWDVIGRPAATHAFFHRHVFIFHPLPPTSFLTHISRNSVVRASYYTRISSVGTDRTRNSAY
jgi:hypothetical protein